MTTMDCVYSSNNSSVYPSLDKMHNNDDNMNKDTNFNDGLDYKDAIYASLPKNARKYFVPSNKLELSYIVSKFTLSQQTSRSLNMLRLYPFASCKYASDNELVLMLINGEYKIYKGPGWFTKIGFTDTVPEIVSIGSEITYGPIKLLYVKPGTLRYGLNIAESRPMILGPGMHYFNDPNIVINSNIINLGTDTNNSVITIDNDKAFNFIIVKTGFNGVVNKRNGELEILPPGIHFCEAPDSFKTFVSIQQETLKFGSTTSNKHKFLTMDNIELSIDATLFYKVVDVNKVFTRNIRDNTDLHDTLLTQARSLLMTLIRSENFSNIGKKKMDMKINKNLQKNILGDEINSLNPDLAIAQPITNISPSPSVPFSNDIMELSDVSVGFQSIVRDIEPQFKQMMQDNFGDTFGFDIQSLRIENIEFADKQMQNKISELSMEFTKLTAQEATINIQRKVEIANAEREAQTQLIKTEAETKRKIISANAENEMIINKNKAQNEIKLQENITQNEILFKTTETETNVSSMKANTEAKNKTVIANAEAEALEKVGMVKYELNKLNAELPHTQIRIMAEAQRDALQGVNKVIYTNEQSMLLKPYMNLIEKDIN
jgi:regulator of protease activity HflC (stomatin/prohibitin superfamily)